MRLTVLVGLGVSLGLLAGCAQQSASEATGTATHDVTSVGAMGVTFSFEGDFYGDSASDSADTVRWYAREQLKYALPQVEALHGAAQLPYVDTLFTSTTSDVGPNGIVHVHYVAGATGVWQGTPPAAPFDVVLPRTRSSVASAPNAAACSPGADLGKKFDYFPLHFSPTAPGCSLPASAVTTAHVTVAATGVTTAAADDAPDYAKMWSDNTLRVYIHFDKADPDASWDDPAAATDEGIATFQKHLDWLGKAFPNATVTSVPFTPDATKPNVHNVQFQHRTTLADGRIVVIDSSLLNPGYNVGVWAPEPPKGANIDVAIVNQSPYANYYIDPDDSFVIWGSAPSENLSLNVSNARFSYELGHKLSSPGTPSAWPKTVEYAGDVPFAVQSPITERVVEALIERTKSFDELGTSIEAIDSKLMPVVSDSVEVR